MDILKSNYSDILEYNKKKKTKKKKFRILILSNIVIDPLKDYLRYLFLKNNYSLDLEQSDYDTIVQSSFDAKNFDIVIVFWELLNFEHDFFLKIQSIQKLSDIKDIEKQLKKKLTFLLNNLSENKNIIFNKFSESIFSHPYFYNDILIELAKRLNKFLYKKKNINFVNIDHIINNVGQKNVLEIDKFISFKILYNFIFFKYYVSEIEKFLKPLITTIKKVLILDCDNTLWGGIISESDFEEIAIANNNIIGSHIYNYIHKKILNLQRQGAILALCSKNDYKIVENFFKQNNLILKFHHFVAKKINWKNKVDNILEISKELNLGLDSFVFIDDSDFEIKLVNNHLPEVKTFKVPNSLIEYPVLINDVTNLFLKRHITSEDRNKTKFYLTELKRKTFEKKFPTKVDYLSSLDLKIEFFWDIEELADRASQMSFKTNQFNLSNKRYTVLDIVGICKSKNNQFVVFELSDKFSSHGITGLCIINQQSKNIFNIDNFLISCRVFGNEAEFYFMNYILFNLKKVGAEKVLTTYNFSDKNIKVKNFIETIGFQLSKTTPKSHEYYINLSKYKFNFPEFIKEKKVKNN
jgi:FkbH-like protein